MKNGYIQDFCFILYQYKPFFIEKRIQSRAPKNWLSAMTGGTNGIRNEDRLLIPRLLKLFSCSAQLRLKFILLINVKMPTIVGILTLMSRINYWL